MKTQTITNITLLCGAEIPITNTECQNIFIEGDSQTYVNFKIANTSGGLYVDVMKFTNASLSFIGATSGYIDATNSACKYIKNTA